MAGTRDQIDSSVAGRRKRSLLRDSDRASSAHTSNDKRPAGPSSFSDPGMGSPTRPLPPGVQHEVSSEFLRHPKIAGGFRTEADLHAAKAETPAKGDDQHE
jgi:hypothetical protein